MKVSFLVTVINIFTFARAAWDQPLRNYLEFSAEFAVTERVLAAFCPTPKVLNVYYRQEGGRGWAMAESNDGYTWKQVLDNVLPQADEGDVVASKIVTQYSYLVAYDSGSRKVIVGGAKSPRLEGFMKYSDFDGRSPTLFQLRNIQYLGAMVPTKNDVFFYQVQPTKNGGIQLMNKTTMMYTLPAGNIRGLQIFCFDNDSTRCLISYSLQIKGKGFVPQYTVGKFEIIGDSLKFEPIAKNTISTYLMDGGQSASNFRLVKFSEGEVIAIGWNGNSDYQIPPVTPHFGNGLTIPRKMRYSDSMMIQTLFEFPTKVQKKEAFNAKDTVLTKTGITKKIDSKQAYLLDLFFYSSHDFDGSGYQIDLIGSKNKRFTIRFNPTLEKDFKKMLMGIVNSETILPPGLDKPADFSLGLEHPPAGRTKVYIDMTTVTVSFEDGLGLVTQSYNLGSDGPFTSYVIKSLGKEDLTLKAKSSVTHLFSIWSSKATTDVPSGAVAAANLSFTFALIFVYAFFN